MYIGRILKFFHSLGQIFFAVAESNEDFGNTLYIIKHG